MTMKTSVSIKDAKVYEINPKTGRKRLVKPAKPTRLYTYNVGVYNRVTGEKLGWHSAHTTRKEAYKTMKRLQEYASYDSQGDHLVEKFTEDVPVTLGFFGKIRKFFTGVHPTSAVEVIICTPIEYRMACWTVDADYACFLMRTHLCHKNVHAGTVPMNLQQESEMDDLPF